MSQQHQEGIVKTFVIVVVLVIACFWFFKKPQPPQIEPVTNLSSALSQAESEGKMLFLLAGREGCSNCRTLRKYIVDGDVRLPGEEFVFADFSCDDKSMYGEFNTRFHVEGRGLPLVVVADSYGRQFASRAGYGTAEEFNQLIQYAMEKMNRYSY
jgi:thioredoxin-related protein